MRSIKVLGLCLVAVFAFSAVAAASAFAEGQPTFKVCGAAAKEGSKYTGKYTNKECTTEASPTEITEGKKNKYELKEVTAGTKYTGKSKTTTLDAKSTTGATEAVVCTKDTAQLEVTGPSSFAETVTFSKCEANGNKHEACTIPATTVSGELYYVNAAETEAGLFTSSPTGEDFKCGASAINEKGSLIGGVANTSTGVTFAYKMSGGHQEHRAFWIDGSEVFSENYTNLASEVEGEVYESPLTGEEAFKAKEVSVRG